MKNSENSLFSYNSEDVRTGEVKIEAERTQKRNRRLNRWIYILLVIGASFILSGVLIWQGIQRINEGLVMELPVGDITPYTISDGQYSGVYSANDLAAAVTVTVETGRITDITLDGFTGIDTARAEKVFDAVIYAQSLATYDEEVGTTPTDVILLLAIEQAFETAADTAEV